MIEHDGPSAFLLQDLLAGTPELVLVFAVVIGFGFGFALERAGFGRATKLAGQFYLTDLTVFKVMFGAIVTASLGLVLLDGVGALSLAALSASAASQTFYYPMAAGGFLLGVGFIVAGYCPGTSLVSAASGNLDGLFTIVGVVVGTLVYGLAYPLLGDFPSSGAHGHAFLYDLLGVAPWIVAVGIVVMAMGLFLVAEKLERSAPAPARAHRSAFESWALAAVAVTVVALGWPVSSRAHVDHRRELGSLTATELAPLVLETPWTIRVIDIRSREECGRARVPGAECVPAPELEKLGLAFSPSERELILVGAAGQKPPAAALDYPGSVAVLDGGFAAWKSYALEAPSPPSAEASAEQRQQYLLRAGISKALTGQAPPPPPPVKGFTAPPAKKGGGCN